MRKNTAASAVYKVILGIFSREHFYLDSRNRAVVLRCWNEFLSRKADEGVITRDQAAMWQKRLS